ncbi:M23 family metallopeptidase [Kiloniella sp.]|uniref:M23 family metallopeptidase n=1 Tax=Kiloniella sp. TaxID=1938587 RepID=UPI003B0128BC
MRFNLMKKARVWPVLFLVLGGATFALSAELELKGYDANPTGITPKYPSYLQCPQLSSLYASWLDVDGSTREQRHVGVDGGDLEDEILAPADGTLVAIWKRNRELGGDWSILISHSSDDLNIKNEGLIYYSEFDHLRFAHLSHLKVNQRIFRGQPIAFVDRPGGNADYLPEVHWEVYEVPVAEKDALVWQVEDNGDEVWWNYSARLIDPLYFMPRKTIKSGQVVAMITPYRKTEGFKSFSGFTYILRCL